MSYVPAVGDEITFVNSTGWNQDRVYIVVEATTESVTVAYEEFRYVMNLVMFVAMGPRLVKQDQYG